MMSFHKTSKNQIATLVEQVVGRNGVDGLDKEGAAPADNNEKG